MVRLLPVLILAILILAAGVLLAGTPFTSDTPEPTAEITGLEITDRGCESDIQEFSSSSSGSNGAFHAQTLDTGDSTVELSGQIRRTSPDDAAITTYRIDLATTPVETDASCPQRVAYRIDYNVTAGSTGTRTAVYLDGEAVSCGGSTSGPDIGCHRIMDGDVRTYWSNASADTE